MAAVSSQSLPPGPAADSISPDRSTSGGRLLWVDNLKGLAIILVVLGHVIGGLNAAGIIPDSNRYDFCHRWIYAFHMPAFFFVAGIFAFRSLRRGSSKLIRDKAAALLYPYALWTIIQWSCHMAMARYTNTQPERWQLLLMFYQPYMNLWFLYGLFLVFVVFAALAAARANGVIMLAIAFVLFAAAQYRAFTFWPLLSRSLESFVYFAIGAAFSDFWIASARRLRPLSALLLGAILFAGMSLLVEAKWDRRILFSIVPALLGVVGTYMAAVAIGEHSWARAIALLGLLSLEIYLIHGIVSVPLRIALVRVLHVHAPLPHILAGVAAGILIPVGLAILSQRMNFPYLFSWRARPGTKPAPLNPSLSIQA